MPLLAPDEGPRGLIHLDGGWPRFYALPLVEVLSGLDTVEARKPIFLGLPQLVSLSINFWKHGRRREAGTARRMKLELMLRQPRHACIAAHMLGMRL